MELRQPNKFVNLESECGHMSREHLWNEWMKLKEEVQKLAGIIQNDVTSLTEEDWIQWRNDVEKFKRDFYVVEITTMRLKKCLT